MSKASIIIPTFNHAAYVAQAVESALDQSYEDCEVIVIDDGSTDATQSILANYGDRIVNVRQANAGLSAARNAGLSVARGEFVLFLDADDWIPPQKIMVQLPYLEDHDELGLTYSAWQDVDSDGCHVLCEVHPRRAGIVLEALLRREFFLTVGSALVRRSCLNEVGNFDPSLRAAEDMDLWLRIARAGFPFGYQDEVLFSYRRTPGSMSSRLSNQMHFELCRLDKFFSAHDLPDDLVALRGTAQAAIYFEYAARYTAAGDESMARRCISAAVTAGPDLVADVDWMLGWISGFAGGVRDADPLRVIDELVDLIPGSPELLHSLRSRARGRLHADMIFRAHEGGRVRDEWRRIWPAVRNEPRLLTNRGFLKVAAVAVAAAVRGGAAESTARDGGTHDEPG